MERPPGPSNWSLGPLPEPYALEWEHSGRSYVVLAGLAWKMLMDAFDAGFGRYRFEHGRSAAFRRDLDPANLALLERSLAGRLLAYDYPLTPTPEGGPPR